MLNPSAVRRGWPLWRPVVVTISTRRPTRNPRPRRQARIGPFKSALMTGLVGRDRMAAGVAPAVGAGVGGGAVSTALALPIALASFRLLGVTYRHAGQRDDRVEHLL